MIRYYNPNLGRLAPWCPLRRPGEDEKWLETVGKLVPAVLEQGVG